jgi:hypothetical protein
MLFGRGGLTHGVSAASGVGQDPLKFPEGTRYSLSAQFSSALGVMSNPVKKHRVALSIGIMVGNEEGSILATLESLFRQSIFERLCVRNTQCEVIVLAYGSTDQTGALVRSFFDRTERTHAWVEGFAVRVIDIPEPSKANAWNRFVHEFSAVEARYLMFMDPRIAFHHRDSIYHLMAELERRPHVSASTGRRCPDLIFKERKTLVERVSMVASSIVDCGERRLDRQLYCLRTSIARHLYLPRDLGPTEAGFIAEMVCTVFLTRDAANQRIIFVPDAAYIFPTARETQQLMNEFQREMMGQAAGTALIAHLERLPAQDRIDLAGTLRRQEATSPDWLKLLLATHLRRRRFFWQIFPGIFSHSLQRLLREARCTRVTRFPAACAGYVTMLIACVRAAHAMRRGMTPYFSKADATKILTASPGTK